MDRQKILLVDDEPQNLQLLRQILKDEYDLLFARGAADALRLALEQRPELILLDVMMPGIDGYELCRRLKVDQRCKPIPVIFVTALSDEDDEAQGFALGAVDYLAKPLRPAVVRMRVRTHLQLGDQRRACLREVQSSHRELLATRLRSLQLLGKAAEYKDHAGSQHVLRLSHYSALLAEWYGWSEEACSLMLNAAPLHDIGKIGIPDSVLLKPGKLDAEEWALMQHHTGIGAELIGELAADSALFELARLIALSHHERWDGSGYPRGLAGSAIPVEGRIVAIADVFDALTSTRPYKPAWPQEKAADYLKAQAGGQFDPELIELFLGHLEQIWAIRERWSD
ncbi:HD-GYP domain-containing protein [Polaromonas sp.]|uniref:HD-GYP domain-containing protein n=1 Tax=Polaromonas sp. TaxID=1869339 RepID=UPI002733FED4|nr:HD domain-containing phosphohydrolase [Polaromonas sp.]MDP3755805.1 response regulator [Polaromonas sp.]